MASPSTATGPSCHSDDLAKRSKQGSVLYAPIALVPGANMNLPVSLAVLVISLALLFFGRGRNGEALPIFRNWIVGMMFSVALLYLFAAGLMGTA
jgi:hypothetical protein